MTNSKLISLLKALNATEMDHLLDFVRSPFFNKDEEVIRLSTYLHQYHPEYPVKELRKEIIYRQLFPHKSYEDKKLRYLFSKLNKYAEHFLALQEMQKKPYKMELALLEDLSRRGLVKSYRHIGKTLSRKMEDRKGDSTDFFLAQFQLAEIEEHHFERKRVRRFDKSIQLASDRLDRYYFLHRLRIVCAMLDRQAILQANYELNLSDGWLEHLESQSFFKEPIILLYHTIYKALSEEENEAHFLALKEMLSKESQEVAFADLRDIYLFAINYCARKIRKGVQKYLEEALQLYRSGIERNILIENGKLSPWAFTNVVKLSLRLQQYDWIEHFIARFAPMLPDEFRENALHYNLAELFYYTRRHDKAQEQLNEVAFSDLNYYLGARVMLAKIYYETDAEEPLLALIASFTIFLKRNKELSSNLKHTYLNFCQLLFQVIRRSPEKLQGIYERIQSTPLLTDREWLKEICKSSMK